MRLSVLEILKETVRDLLSDRASSVEFAESNGSLVMSCTENEFTTLEEFKTVCIGFSVDS